VTISPPVNGDVLAHLFPVGERQRAVGSHRVVLEVASPQVDERQTQERFSPDPCTLEGTQTVPLHALELFSPLLKRPLGRVVLFEKITMSATQVTATGDVDRAEAVFGDAEEEEAELGKIVEGEERLGMPGCKCNLLMIHETSPHTELIIIDHLSGNIFGCCRLKKKPMYPTMGFDNIRKTIKLII